MKIENILWQDNKYKIIENEEEFYILENDFNKFVLSNKENNLYIEHNGFRFCDYDLIDVSFLSKKLKNGDFDLTTIHKKEYSILEFCDYVRTIWLKERSIIKRQIANETGGIKTAIKNK